jgi:alpha-methylacyl-CoA racemase
VVRVARRNRRCFAPVLTFSEARSYPHHVERDSFVDDRPEVAISPRLSRTPGDPRASSPAYPGADTDTVLADYGFSTAEIA